MHPFKQKSPVLSHVSFVTKPDRFFFYKCKKKKVSIFHYDIFKGSLNLNLKLWSYHILIHISYLFYLKAWKNVVNKNTSLKK